VAWVRNRRVARLHRGVSPFEPFISRHSQSSVDREKWSPGPTTPSLEGTKRGFEVDCSRMGGVCRAIVQPAGYEVALLRYGIESGCARHELALSHSCQFKEITDSMGRGSGKSSLVARYRQIHSKG
jgi:hypothetical protein